MQPNDPSLMGKLSQLGPVSPAPPKEAAPVLQKDATERARWQAAAAYSLFASSIHWAEIYRNAIITGYVLGTGWLVSGVLLRNLKTMPLWQQLLVILLGYVSTLVCHILEERRCRDIVNFTNAGLEAELAEPTQSVRYYDMHDATFNPWAFTKVEYFLFIGWLIWTSTFVWVVLPHTH